MNPDVSPLYDYVTYTAPNQIPPQDKNPVQISAEFNQNFFLISDHDTTVASDKVTLYSHIRIYGGGYHVELSFKADSVNEGGAYYNITDKSSFDVLDGNPWTITNITNNNSLVTYLYNDGTCTITNGPDAQGPIQVLDSGLVFENPILNSISVSFNRAVNPAYYVLFPSWYSQCGTDLETLGGGLGPPFPAAIQFNTMDPNSSSVQTITSGQYTIAVSVIK
jgi:hypothetical protein